MYISSTRNHPPPEAVIFNQPEDVVTLVSISPFEEDHAFLRQVFDHSHWRIHGVRNGKEALALSRRLRPAVVVCEEQLPDCAWKEILAGLSPLPDAPLLIVTSRLADDALWAEVLNLGGYDLLMKPLDRIEVLRVVHLAWRHWKDSREEEARPAASQASPLHRATA